MRRAVLLLVGWTMACSARPGLTPALSNTAPVPRRPACAQAVIDDVAAALRARWGEADDFVRVTCTAGNFPEPGYFISVIGPDATRHRFGVIAPDRTTTVEFASGPVAHDTELLESAAIDLDGNGIDEIVEVWRRDSADTMATYEWVVVRRLGDARLVEIAGPHLNVSFPNLGACTARCELDGGTLVVTVSNLPGIPPSACLAPGRHVFALRGDQLVSSRRR